jgi:hypothetical protein
MDLLAYNKEFGELFIKNTTKKYVFFALEHLMHNSCISSVGLACGGERQATAIFLWTNITATLVATSD